MLVCALPWDTANDPRRMVRGGLVYQFNRLPLSGSTARAPWSGWYWPSNKGGLAYRFEERNGFGYRLFSRKDLRRLPEARVKALSPAEKFDIFVGRYDYPTVRSEWRRTSPRAPSWFGLCHGWAPAAISYTQPRPLTVINRDGIRIPFGASDIKGLLTYFAAMYQNLGQTRSAGRRCNGGRSHACYDMNAGSFHLILTNLLALRGQSFVIDKKSNHEVWNQPMQRFRSTVSGSPRSPTVTTTLTYVNERLPEWNQNTPDLLTMTLRYVLQLDGARRIRGGRFLTAERPDFVWRMPVQAPSGYFAPLRQLLRSAGAVARAAAARGNATGPFDFDDEADADDCPPVYTLPNHANLTAPRGTFGLRGYRPGSRHSWSLQPSCGDASHVVASIALRFTHLRIDAGYEAVKVYEGQDCSGALVAAYDGFHAPEPITIEASSACVVFVSDGTRSDRSRSVVQAHNLALRARNTSTSDDSNSGLCAIPRERDNDWDYPGNYPLPESWGFQIEYAANERMRE